MRDISKPNQKCLFAHTRFSVIRLIISIPHQLAATHDIVLYCTPPSLYAFSCARRRTLRKTADQNIHPIQPDGEPLACTGPKTPDVKKQTLFPNPQTISPSKKGTPITLTLITPSQSPPIAMAKSKGGISPSDHPSTHPGHKAWPVVVAYYYKTKRFKSRDSDRIRRSRP